MSFEHIRRATASDLDRVADMMRPLDKQEVHLSHGHTPAQALASASELCAPCAIVRGGEAVMAFGLYVPESTPHLGSPWALGTSDLQPATIMRWTKPIISGMRSQVKLLVNFVWSGNIPSVNWLSRSGFNLSEPTPYGAHGALFRRFTMEGDHV